MPKIWLPKHVNQNKHSFANESRMARWFGEQMLRMLLETAQDLHCQVPILYTPKGGVVHAVDGHLVGMMAGGAFTSLSDLIAEASAGKRQDFFYSKTGTASNAAGASVDLWRVATLPPSAGAAAALAAGTHNDNTTVGGPGQVDPAGGDTLHLTTMLSQATVVPNLLMMYDRLWNGLIALSSLAVQTCTLTGYPNGAGRYSTAPTSSNPGAAGNFAFVSNPAGASLSAVAHTWTLNYIDQAGNAAENAAAIAGVSGCLINCVDHALWFIPLNAGDTGIQDINSIACSVNTVAAGSPTIVLAHPLALIPQLVANQAVVMDGINSAFNLVEIKTDACPAFLEVNKPATTATTYVGQATMVSG